MSFEPGRFLTALYPARKHKFKCALAEPHFGNAVGTDGGTVNQPEKQVALPVKFFLEPYEL